MVGRETANVGAEGRVREVLTRHLGASMADRLWSRALLRETTLSRSSVDPTASVVDHLASIVPLYTDGPLCAALCEALGALVEDSVARRCEYEISTHSGLIRARESCRELVGRLGLRDLATQRVSSGLTEAGLWMLERGSGTLRVAILGAPPDLFELGLSSPGLPPHPEDLFERLDPLFEGREIVSAHSGTLTLQLRLL